MALILIALSIAGVPSNAQQKSSVEILPQLGHSALSQKVLFSPDGKLLLSLGLDGLAKLWNFDSGVLIRDFKASTLPYTAAAFSPDGQRLLIAFWESNTIAVAETATGKTIFSKVLPGFGDINTIAYSPSGRQFLSGGRDGTIRIWNASTGAVVRSIKGHAGSVIALAFSRDGRRFASGGADKWAKLWDGASGQLVRTFEGHSHEVATVAVSGDGRRVLSGDKQGSTRLWDANTGQLLRSLSRQPVPPKLVEGFDGKKTLSTVDSAVATVAFSPDGTLLAIGYGDGAIEISGAADGGLRRSLKSAGQGHFSFSPDGRHIAVTENFVARAIEVETGAAFRIFAGGASFNTNASFSASGMALSVASDAKLRLWDMRSGRHVRTFDEDCKPKGPARFLPDGRHFIVTCPKVIKLYDTETGALVRPFEAAASSNDLDVAFAFSADGRWMASGGADKTGKLWEMATGRLVRTFDGHAAGERAFDYARVELSADGSRLLVSALTTARLYDGGTGRLLRSIVNPRTAKPGEPEIVRITLDGIQALAFTPDSKFILVGYGDRSLKMFDAGSGATLREFNGRPHDHWTEIAFSADGTRILTGSFDGTVQMWDAGRGTLLQTFTGHAGTVRSVAFSADRQRIMTSSTDGTLRIWDAATGRWLALLASGKGEDWLTMTAEGFIAGSRRDPDMLAIVRGTDATSVGQVHQSLFQPDLVREAAANDPDGEVRAAARLVNLDVVLKSGPAPDVTIVSPVGGGQLGADLLDVTARIFDRGKGVGRIEWRLNGITAAVAAKPEAVGAEHIVTRRIALDAGKNEIEVVAYNGSNLLASLPARSTVTYTGPVDVAKPRLHVLAIGIDDYTDPGVEGFPGFGKLHLAVADAKALAAELKRAAKGHYAGEPNIVVLSDAKATRDGIAAAIAQMEHDIHPRDTFILFAAGHGITREGRFYLIPHSYSGGAHRSMLKRGAIGQDMLQDWLANRVKAKRALVLLDTCESGGLIAGHLRSRSDAAASEAGLGRLHEATGRPVLTAAAMDQSAIEGVIENGVSHGIFTWAVLDALRNGDADKDGNITVSELVAHVQTMVPRIASEKLKKASPEEQRKRGATIEFRGAGANIQPTRKGAQSARFGSRGEDFVIARRIQ